MPVQTSIVASYPIAYAGMRADTSPCDTLSAYNRQGANLPFGVAVIKGTGVNDVKLPTGATVSADLLGIVEFTHAYKNYDLSGSTDAVPVGGMVNLARKGRYYVKVEAAVTAQAQVYVRIATGTGTQLGAFRGDADTATAIAWTGVKYLTSASSGGYAIIDINLP